MLSELINDYIKKLCAEQESLIARYIQSTGYKPEDICLVERGTPNGRVFFPDLKAKYNFKDDEVPSAE